jgi:uncharacterized protein YndB with AHSA1/START domain
MKALTGWMTTWPTCKKNKKRKSMTTNKEAPPRVLTLVRILDAPRELVFKLWTDPGHLVTWWGPKDFTNPVCEFDARVGGTIRIHMRGPDGTVYPMGGTVEEVVEPKRLVFTSTAFEGKDGQPLLINRNTVTFDDLDGKTKLTLHVCVVKAGPGTEEVLGGMDQGWSESFERLLDLAADTAGIGEAHIVGTRLFDAPRELVWKTWTEPELLAPWWGPVGFTNTIEVMDVRPGGVWRFVMHGPDGTNYPNERVYVEVVKPQLLVIDHICQPQHRFCATFIAEGDKTRVTVRMYFPSAELCTEIARKFGAVEGLSQNFDRLADYLSSKANR